MNARLTGEVPPPWGWPVSVQCTFQQSLPVLLEVLLGGFFFPNIDGALDPLADEITRDLIILADRSTGILTTEEFERSSSSSWRSPPKSGYL